MVSVNLYLLGELYPSSPCYGADTIPVSKMAMFT